MSSTIKPLYGSNNQTISFSGLDSLGNGSVVFSSAVDNSSNLYEDVLVAGSFVAASSGVSSTGTVAVLVAASTDGGTTYPSNIQ